MKTGLKTGFGYRCLPIRRPRSRTRPCMSFSGVSSMLSFGVRSSNIWLRLWALDGACPLWEYKVAGASAWFYSFAIGYFETAAAQTCSQTSFATEYFFILPAALQRVHLPQRHIMESHDHLSLQNCPASKVQSQRQKKIRSGNERNNAVQNMSPPSDLAIR